MVIRKHGRYPACWPLTLIHNGIEYQGTMQNISLKGCAVTTCLPAFVGMHLRWQMRAPDHSEPLCIQKAFVRWRRQDVMGLGFSQMGEAEQSRLGRVIQDLESARPNLHTSWKNRPSFLLRCKPNRPNNRPFWLWTMRRPSSASAR